MQTNGPNKEAEAGSLSRRALADLLLMREFLDARDAAIYTFLGVQLRRSALRDELIRTCVIEFGLGRTHRVSYYEDHCVDFGSASAVKREIRTLLELNVFVSKPDPSNARAILIVPTKRLVSFYANSLRSLVEDIEALFTRRD